jgi:uncharacterized membrane protein
MTDTRALLRAALAGAATGSRSFSALAACTVTAPKGRTGTRWVRRRGRQVVLLGAAGELVGDKLPQAPPRTAPPALYARLGLAALTAVVLARRRGESIALAALVGTAASAGTTFAGPGIRGALAARVGQDRPGALAEDAFAYTLALVAARLP